MASYLEVWRPAGRERIPLAGRRVTVGAEPSNDLCLDHDRTVSRVHGVFELYANAWGLRDLGSRNGTFVNGKRISECLLRDGDEIRLGTTRIYLRSTVEPERRARTQSLQHATIGLEQRGTIRASAAPDGTVTVLFSDIEGSTAANERLGDARWLEVLRGHNHIVRTQVAACGGFEVKAQGDGFMVAFSSARSGLLCAIGIQRSLRDHAEERPDDAVVVRIGLHTGEVLREGDDFFGRHVIMAARISAAARGGEILVSSLLRDLTRGVDDIRFGERRELALKGISGTHDLYPVLW
jgi:class 3 adenylate cyclase